MTFSKYFLKHLAFFILIFVSALTALKAGSYTIEDTYEGCEFGRYYALTNGQFLRCDEYSYSYSYRPEVLTNGRRVLKIDGEEVSGTIVDGRKIDTQIDGEWEGCDFDTHRLLNGLILVCNTYFYEYAFMPSVEIIIIEGVPISIKIGSQYRDGVVVLSP